MAQVSSPDPTAAAAPAATSETTEALAATSGTTESAAPTGGTTQALATPKPVPTIEPVAPDSDLAILEIQDIAGSMEQVMNSPELMAWPGWFSRDVRPDWLREP